MKAPITFAIAGFGDRGSTYASMQKLFPDKMKVVAVADLNPQKVEKAQKLYDIPAENCFASAEEMLEQEKLADVLVVSTMDRQHVGHAIPGLRKGYNILLEKPVSPELDKCRELLEVAKGCPGKVIVCHVLRYTAFYNILKDLLDKGEIGQVVSICANENVAYWHQAHSFVRGNWRNSQETSPMILQKSCHDMDILRWLAGDRCLKIQSFGSLDHFRPENAPEGAAERCLDGCLCRERCLYDAERIYLDGPHCGLRQGKDGWPNTVVAGGPPTEEKLYAALRTGPYGRCVYRCDNDVVDRQTVNMTFANGVCATFTMTAFTETCRRSIKLTGTEGEIEGDMEKNTLLLRRFGEEERVISLDGSKSEFAGHGGGDAGLIEQFCRLIETGGTESLTGIDASVESHVMALAAEASRLRGGETVTLADFR